MKKKIAVPTTPAKAADLIRTPAKAADSERMPRTPWKAADLERRTLTRARNMRMTMEEAAKLIS